MEILDLINDKDEVIGQADYDEVHEKNLLHRIIHVLLFDKKGQVLLQLRSSQKSAYPLYWSFSAGGHVQSSETYEDALIRESEEELGLIFTPDAFQLKGKGEFISEKGHRSFYKTYAAMYDAPLEVVNSEVAKVQFFDWGQIKAMIDAGEKMHPEMVSILQRHWNLVS